MRCLFIVISEYRQGELPPIIYYYYFPDLSGSQYSTGYVSADQIHPHACLEFVLVLKPAHAKAYVQWLCMYKLYYTVSCDE